MRYQYVGGGYFRDSRIEKGKSAPLLHAPELADLLQRLHRRLVRATAAGVETWPEYSELQQLLTWPEYRALAELVE